MSKGNDLTGLTFDRLTVIKQVERPPHLKTRGKYYLCKCVCGNELIVYGRSLKSGNTRSCGCLFKDAHTGKSLVGEKFGRLVVIKEVSKPDNKKKNETYWLCKCDCGNEKICGRSELISDNVNSCGCLREELNKQSRKQNRFVIMDDYVIAKDDNDREFLIDIDDYYRLLKFGRYWFVSKRVFNGREESYVESKANGETIRLHNFIMNPAEGEVVDHINGDTMDNRKQNLRITNEARNAQNRATPRNNTSGVKGVHFNGRMNKWVARIGYFGKRIHLGAFDSFEEAVKARKEAEEKYYGEFNRKE